MIEIQGDGSLRYMEHGHPELGRAGAGLLQAFGIEPLGIIHIGAHFGEEVPMYVRLGFRDIKLFEPGRHASDYLTDRFRRWESVDLYLAWAIADAPETTGMWHIPNDAEGMTGTLTKEADPNAYPVTVSRLAPLQKIWGKAGALPNVLVVDTQGTELEVIRTANLEHIDLIIAETRDPGTDAPAADFTEADTYLRTYGFLPVERWRHGQHAYSDVVWVHEGNLE